MASTTTAAPIVSTEEVQLLRGHLEKVQLSPEQLDALSNIWLDAPNEEKPIIAKCYPQYFSDAHFVSKLSARGCARLNKNNSTRGGGGNSSSNNNSGADDKKQQDIIRSRKLRGAIDTAVQRLSGPGPHVISFGVVNNEYLNQQAISLYSTQFRYPDATELQRMITVPRKLSTRTRKKTTGNYTWFIECEATDEIACAVSVNIHNAGTFIFVEMPLFATAVGYKRLGLARLLNAALQEHCVDIGASFILVSADPDAVDFWCTPSLGYKPISTGQRQRIDFHYANDCSKFQDSHLLTWEAPTSRPQGGLGLVEAALGKMPKIMVKGPPKLPIP